jgi:formylglycine-generating enzyme required for sulfatase activity
MRVPACSLSDKKRSGFRRPLFVGLALIAALQFGGASSAMAQAKKTKVNPKDGLTYVWIEAGTFTMGCSPDDDACQSDERPPHKVTLSKGFWIGQTQVTQAAYMKVTGMSPSNFKGDKLPVETVNYSDANKYCQAVDMRLPTEAEWEFAARGGSPNARYGAVDEIGWSTANSEVKTHEVGQKKPNAYGLYDMLGNVWQWVADWYGRYDDAAVTDPKGPATGTARLLRGGSWLNVPGLMRASYRNGSQAMFRLDSFGIRCAGD